MEQHIPHPHSAAGARPGAAAEPRGEDRRLSTVMDGCRELIAALDLEFRFVACNEAYRREFARIAGREVAVGMSLSDVLAHRPEDRAKALDCWGRALDGEEFTFIGRLAGDRPDGPIYEASFSALRDEARRRVGAVFVARNVADRVRTEEEGRRRSADVEQQIRAERRQAEAARDESESELRRLVEEGEERFRGIFENAAVGVVRVDAEGRFTQVNQTLCDIVGYRREELLRMRFQEITHPDDLEADLDLFGPLMRGDLASYSIEKRYLHKHGHVIWVNLTTAVQRDAGGAPQFCVAIIEDITSRRQAEQELRDLNETLEQRIAQRTAQLRLLATELTQAEQRERRRLAYVLHEDIQQLMVAVKMKVGQLGLHVGEPLLGEVRQAEHLLQQLIHASRSLAVQLSPPILYDAGLAAALEWLARKIEEEYGLKVAVRADESAEPADQNISLFLLQSVRELLLNVVKYAGTSDARVLMSRGEGDQVQITVEDDGVGMDLQALHTQEATADRFGLFSIEHRLDLLGGHFALSSSPGQGTSATLMAPLKTPEPKLDGLASAVSAGRNGGARRGDGSRVRVLLVDDHRILRQGLARLLSAEEDVDVVGEAADGQQAVELARQLDPHVVCMDVTMPRLNGIEATRIILQERPWVRVIGLSMHESDEMAGAMLEAGAVAYLSKDGPSDVLVGAIRAAGAAAPAANAP